MSKLMGEMELLLKLGGMKEDITFLVISGAAVKMEEKEAWRKIFSSAPALHPARQRRCVRSRGRNRGLFRLLRPSKSWQMVAPHFSSNCFTNSLEPAGRAFAVCQDTGDHNGADQSSAGALHTSHTAA